MIRLLVATLLLVPSFAAADRVTVKGTVLEGKVKAISSKKILMETIYGKGVRLKPKEMKALESQVVRLAGLGKWFVEIPAKVRDG